MSLINNIKIFQSNVSKKLYNAELYPNGWCALFKLNNNKYIYVMIYSGNTFSFFNYQDKVLISSIKNEIFDINIIIEEINKILN